MKRSVITILFISFLSIFIFHTSVFALNVGFLNNKVWISKEQGIELDEQLKIYSIIVNNEETAIGGEIIFIDIKTNQQVGGTMGFSLPGNGGSTVLSTYWRAQNGEHQFEAKIINAYKVEGSSRRLIDTSILSQVTKEIFVDTDDDNDGISNRKEEALGTDPNNADTDGDGLSDSQDFNPLNADTDGDGDKDGTDPEPQNADVFTPFDTDNDGILDINDNDIDNDGLYNWQEERLGTNPLKVDTDGDGINDLEDSDPLSIILSDISSKNIENLEATGDIKFIKTEVAKLAIAMNTSDEDEFVTPLFQADAKNSLDDYDKDGLADWIEVVMGTNPKKIDTDGDGINDMDDSAPLQANDSELIPIKIIKNVDDSSDSRNLSNTLHNAKSLILGEAHAQSLEYSSESNTIKTQQVMNKFFAYFVLILLLFFGVFYTAHKIIMAKKEPDLE